MSLDRHALVTGGSRGIGAAVALALKTAGARITIVGRTESTLSQAIKAGIADDYIVSDIRDAESLASGINRAEQQFGPVDILVNNAGGASSASFTSTLPSDFLKIFDLNVMGTVHATMAVIGGMNDRGWGRIVNIASTASLKGYKYVSPYVTAKHALLGLTRSLALEYARSGITVNAVCPGFTNSDMLQENIDNIVKKTGRSIEQALSDLTSNNPQRRLIEPNEVAQTVVFICSNEAASINGVALPIAGGEVM